MKPNVIKTVVFALFIVVLASRVTAKNPHPQRKEISHLFSQIQMTNSGVLSNASGLVSIHLNAQSKGNPLDIRIRVHGLDTNQTYQLAALLANDTNFTIVTSFTTDARGNTMLDFRQKLAGPPSKHPVPAALNPISNVRELAILDAASQTVLDANLTAPDKFEYLLKRDFSTNSVEALLQINADSHKAQVRVTASGLASDSAYSLDLNGATVATDNSDARGRLHVAFQLDQPLDIFSLQSVAILDSATNVVASTNLP